MSKYLRYVTIFDMLACLEVLNLTHCGKEKRRKTSGHDFPHICRILCTSWANDNSYRGFWRRLYTLHNGAIHLEIYECCSQVSASMFFTLNFIKISCFTQGIFSGLNISDEFFPFKLRKCYSIVHNNALTWRSTNQPTKLPTPWVTL